MDQPQVSPPHDEGRTSSTGTSRTLLQRVKSNEPAAWDRLVALYGPLVYHWCRSWRLREDDVGDVFQEVFQAVAARVAGFRKEAPTDTFRGWLRSITHSKVHDCFRRRSREPNAIGGTDALMRFAEVPAPSPAEPPPGNDDEAERGLFTLGLDLIRHEFEERTWKAFWQTTVLGRATADVAADLSMSPGAVRVAKSRVLHRLREELGDLLDE